MGSCHYFAGIDGGGSNTRVLLFSDDGSHVALGLSGPANPNHGGPEITLRAVREGLDRAWQKLNRPAQPLSGLFLGLAGVTVLPCREAFRQALAETAVVPASACGLDHDLRIAHAGAHGAQPGLVLIAGTGSAAYGRNGRGEVAECGGWGALLDDGGGGYWLALAGFRTAVRQADGRLPRGPVLAEALRFFGVSQPSEILPALRPIAHLRHELARFAPVLLHLAAEGDAASQALARSGAEELAHLAGVITQRLFPEGRAPLAWTGGLSEHSYYRGLLHQALHLLAPRTDLVESQHPPVIGAALLATQAAGRPLLDAAPLQHLTQASLSLA